MLQKKTLQREIYFSGIGIHSGQRINMCLKPSVSGRITFKRIDLNELEVTLDPKNIVAKNCSQLISQNCNILTIEHLMAVLFVQV